MIHPTAIVSPLAKVDSGCEIGPLCIVGDHATVGFGAKLYASSVVHPHVVIGNECRIHAFANIGGGIGESARPRVIIEDRVEIREYAQVVAARDGMPATRLCEDALVLAYVTVGASCHIGAGVVISSTVSLGEEITVGVGAGIMGMSVVKDGVRIGKHAFLGGKAMLEHDLPPFVLADGLPASLRGLNMVGLKRLAVPYESILELKQLYRTLATLTAAVESIEEARERFTGVESGEFLTFVLAARNAGRSIAPSTHESRSPRRSANLSDDAFNELAMHEAFPTAANG